MTTLAETRTAPLVDEEGPARSPATAETGDGDRGRRRTPTGGFDPRRLAIVSALGVVVLVVAVGAVLYGVGPLVHDRDQRQLLATEQAAIARAARDNEGLYRAAPPTQPPAAGSLVGILAIRSLGLQQAVIEGVSSSQTVAGPGHVAGTAGLGQPGNSVVVGRRSAYGGPFGHLAELRPGDQIVTATIQGESLYVVRSVRTVTVVTPSTTSSVTTTSGSPAVSLPHKSPRSSTTPQAGSTTTVPIAKPPATTTVTSLYGPSSHDQLTLITSATSVPWNSDQVVVVVARMRGESFAPTPQESRNSSQLGSSGDPDALGWLLLALIGFVGVVAGAIAVYRRTTVRTAYLLTTAPLLALTVLTAEAASHLLPAWL